jgi:hypothetical protein
MLPAAEGETPQRRGFFIGDGTGVGKGREIAGIILDNWSRAAPRRCGCRRSASSSTTPSATGRARAERRDLQRRQGEVRRADHRASRASASSPTTRSRAACPTRRRSRAGGFVRKQEVKVNGARARSAPCSGQPPGVQGAPARSRSSSSGTQSPSRAPSSRRIGEPPVKSRVDQLVDWFGKDFDGVIAFDEAHNMGNAVDQGRARRQGRGAKGARRHRAAGAAAECARRLRVGDRRDRSLEPRLCRAARAVGPRHAVRLARRVRLRGGGGRHRGDGADRARHEAARPLHRAQPLLRRRGV